MLDTLDINNFQSHKGSRLHFVPGVNVIIGPSDSGKSAILRAAYWVLFNQPSGQGFRRHDTKETKVTIAPDTLEAVTRTRTASKNLYWLDGQSYKAMGKWVPEPIQDLFKITDLNVQRQMDAPFLLSNSSGQVARYLNDLIGLDDIDTALSNLESRKRRASSELKQAKDQEDALLGQISKYDSLPDIEAELAICIEDSRKFKAKQGHLSALISAIRQAKDEQAKLKKLPNTDQIKKVYKRISEAADRYKQTNADIKALDNAIRSARQAKEQLASASSRVKQFQTQYQELMPEECPLCGQPVKK